MTPWTCALIPYGIAFVSLIGLAACRDRGGSSGGAHSGSPSRPVTSPTQPTPFTGTLQSGVAAIGGETTGWRLIGDGATGGFDVDVSSVRAQVKSLDGQRVIVTGRMTKKSWPERGETQVLVADGIEPAAGGAK